MVYSEEVVLRRGLLYHHGVDRSPFYRRAPKPQNPPTGPRGPNNLQICSPSPQWRLHGLMGLPNRGLLSTMLYHIIQYHTLPYHTIPYYTIPYYTIPYHTIPSYDTIGNGQLQTQAVGRRCFGARAHSGLTFNIEGSRAMPRMDLRFYMVPHIGVIYIYIYFYVYTQAYVHGICIYIHIHTHGYGEYVSLCMDMGIMLWSC